ncbi:MAG: thiamine phosphate synthase [Acholeplasmatales bacterium]|nr:thiamine phosphate synthase [Acholeplasmatales bacterium]
MKDLISSLKIYAVTDRYWLNGKELADDVEKAILGGATMIQLREKDLDLNSFVAEALKIKEVCKKYDIPFIINDSLEVFLAVDADGIHVGQNDMRADLVREKIGKNKILGVSAETVEEAILAEKMGADYLGVGTIFNTSTKLDAITVSKETLTNICFAVDIPVVAIGGITKDNIKELKDTFIDGISIVSAIFAEKDIISATKKLNYEVDKILFNPQKYNYFIIDYDGTLLNSLDMWADIASRYIKSKGLTPEVDLDLIVKKQTNAETAAYMKEKYFNNLEVDEVAKDIDSFIAKEYLSIKINEGVKEFLDLLKNNGKLVLFTATSYPLIEASLKNNNIFNYFEEFYTSTNFDYSKTDGTGFELLKEQNNLDLEKTLVIEDALHALVGAKLKGFNVLGIKTKKNIKDYDTIRKSCDYYIDIRKWIK